jgi:hypothetical protein
MNIWDGCYFYPVSLYGNYYFFLPGKTNIWCSTNKIYGEKIMKKTYLFLLVFGLLLAACAAPSAVEVPGDLFVEANAVNTPRIEIEDSPIEVGEYTEITLMDDSGSTSIEQAALDEALSLVPTGGLTAVEIEGLAFMREEEKLARDVYLVLYDQWNIPIFQNILIERFGIEDPAVGNGVGEFTNPDLQALYDQLVSQGSQSLADALKVGAAIEEIDILDLEERLAQTDKGDIIMVYEKLLKGSRNHLRSFTNTITQQTGETYVPQYLSLDAYGAIIGTGIESGGASGRGSGQGQGKNSNGRNSGN